MQSNATRHTSTNRYAAQDWKNCFKEQRRANNNWKRLNARTEDGPQHESSSATSGSASRSDAIAGGDAASAGNVVAGGVFGRALQTELFIIEALAEDRAEAGQHILWHCLKEREREGRRQRTRGKTTLLRRGEVPFFFVCLEVLVEGLAGRPLLLPRHTVVHPGKHHVYHSDYYGMHELSHTWPVTRP